MEPTMESTMLSPSSLDAATVKKRHRQLQSLPRRGFKKQKLDSEDDEQADELAADEEQEHEEQSVSTALAIKEWADRAAVPRWRTLPRLCVAVWDDETNLAHLVINSGNSCDSVGFSQGGKEYLYGEEALFLMEQGVLELFRHEMPLSIQEGYSILLGPACPIRLYQVYAHLKRFGLVVARHNPRRWQSNNSSSTDTSDNEEVDCVPSPESKSPETHSVHSGIRRLGSNISQRQPSSNVAVIHFDIWVKTSSFKRSAPGRPAYTVHVSQPDHEYAVTPATLRKLHRASLGCRVRIARVQGGAVTFFTCLFVGPPIKAP